MTPRDQVQPTTIKFRPLWLVLGWLLVLFVIYVSVIPDPVQFPVAQGDKFGHVLAYAVLMSWFANLYRLTGRRMQFAIGFVSLGIALEFVQQQTGYRSLEVADMAADAAGVVVGWLVAPPRIPNYLHEMGKLLHRA